MGQRETVGGSGSGDGQSGGDLEFSIPKTAMAVACGDEWTNIFQPFWALPLLGITGLKAGNIMGYTVMVMFLSAPVFILALLFID